MLNPETRGSVTHDRETWRTMDDCWRDGDLQHLLDDNQLSIYEKILACGVLQFVIEAGRKVGKSWLLGVCAFEAAQQHPGGRINYAAPTVKECAEITLPIMKQLAELAPDDCRPVWKASVGHWEFPNGAFIVLFGADDEEAANKGRGPESVLNIIDEGGFTPVLLYMIESVLAPQTLQALSARGMFAKRRGAWLGRTLIASSPPKTPGHDFAEIADAAAAQGAYVHRDVYSHGRMTREEIEAYLTQRAMSRNMTLEQFKKTSDFRREYMAERVIDTALAVVPEWTDVAEAVKEAGRVAVRPPWWDLYIAGDPGMDHLFGVLFAYSDFRRSRLVIEHELLLSKANTQTVATAIGDVMRAHYPADADDLRSVKMKMIRLVDDKDFAFVVRPYSATFDDPGKRLCADMWTYHGLQFTPALKDDREAAINAMRIEVGGRRVEIHPRCVNLIRQLGTAVRTKPGGDLAVSKRDGHFDLISTLWYLVRAWDKSHNPYPVDYGFDPRAQVRRDPPRSQPGTLDDYLARR